MSRKKTLQEWMVEVDKHIAAKAGGLTHEDLVDCCYSDWYDEGYSPSRAAAKAIRAEMGGPIY